MSCLRLLLLFSCLWQVFAITPDEDPIPEYTMGFDRSTPGTFALAFPTTPGYNIMDWCPLPSQVRYSIAITTPVASNVSPTAPAVPTVLPLFTGTLATNTNKLPGVNDPTYYQADGIGGYGLIINRIDVQLTCARTAEQSAAGLLWYWTTLNRQANQVVIAYPIVTEIPIVTYIRTRTLGPTLQAAVDVLVTGSFSGLDLLGDRKLIVYIDYNNCASWRSIPAGCVGGSFIIDKNNREVACQFSVGAGCDAQFKFRYVRVPLVRTTVYDTAPDSQQTSTYYYDFTGSVFSAAGPPSDLFKSIGRPRIAGVVNTACGSTSTVNSVAWCPITGCRTSVMDCPAASDLLTIYGQYFSTAAGVLLVQLTSLNGLACPTCAIEPTFSALPTRIVCRLLPATPGANCAIGVSNESGESASFGVDSTMTFLPAPVITSLIRDTCSGSPSLALVGCSKANGPLTINGANFGLAPTVTLTGSGCGTCLSVIVTSGVKIVCVLSTSTIGPAVGSCAITVVVTMNSSPTVASISYAAVPYITNIVSSCGSGMVLKDCPVLQASASTPLTITGANFYGALIQVKFTTSTGNCFAVCTSAQPLNPQTIVCSFSGGAVGAGPCRLYVEGTYGDPMASTVNASPPAPSFSYAAIPIVSSLSNFACATAFSKFYCPTGSTSTLTILGSNFFQVPISTSVSSSFGTGVCGSCIESLVDVGGLRMTCRLGSSSGDASCPVLVTSRGGVSVSTGPRVEFIGIPTINSLGFNGCTNSPAKALVGCTAIEGNSLTINGANLVGANLRVAGTCGLSCDNPQLVLSTMTTCTLTGTTSGVNACVISIQLAVGGNSVNTVPATITFKAAVVISSSSSSSSSTGVRSSSSSSLSSSGLSPSSSSSSSSNLLTPSSSSSSSRSLSSSSSSSSASPALFSSLSSTGVVPASSSSSSFSTSSSSSSTGSLSIDPPLDSEGSSSTSALPVGAIIGIAVGGVGLVAAVSFLVYRFRMTQYLPLTSDALSNVIVANPQPPIATTTTKPALTTVQSRAEAIKAMRARQNA